MSAKNELFLKTICFDFLWPCSSPDLRVGDLFRQKNDFVPCFFRSSNFVSIFNDFGLHLDHLGEDLG